MQTTAMDGLKSQQVRNKTIKADRVVAYDSVLGSPPQADGLQDPLAVRQVSGVAWDRKYEFFRSTFCYMRRLK